MKYFKEDNLTENQVEQLKLIDEEWAKREKDAHWKFISKKEVKAQKGVPNFIWESIIDLIPIQVEM